MTGFRERLQPPKVSYQKRQQHFTTFSRLFLLGDPSENGLKIAKFTIMDKSIIFLILISRHLTTFPENSRHFPTYPGALGDVGRISGSFWWGTFIGTHQNKQGVDHPLNFSRRGKNEPTLYEL